MNVPVIEEIIKQLLDREDGLLSSSMLQADMTRAFGTRGTQTPRSSRQGSIRSVTKMLPMRGFSHELSLLLFQLEGCSRIPEAKYDTPKKRAAELENARKRFK